MDSGKCLAWSQYVLLDGVPMTGQQIFEKVKTKGAILSRVDGGEVYSFQGNEVVSINDRLEPEKAESSLYIQRYSGPMYSIRGKTGRELTVTPEHPLLINRRGSVQWTKAKDIREGDYAAFLGKVPLDESALIPDGLSDMRTKYSIVTFEDYESLKTLTSHFRDLSSLSTEELEKVRILAVLSRSELETRGKIGAASYARNVREGRPHSPSDRHKIVQVLQGSPIQELKARQFLAEQKLSAGRRIRLINSIESFDEDIVKWFAFVWSEGNSRDGAVTVTQTTQPRMLEEYIEITRERFGLKGRAYKKGRYAVYSTALVDYLRFGFAFNPGNETICGIADWVCKLPSGLKAAFLRWFFTLDGEFNDKGEITITQLNERNIVIISYLLHSFGIVPKFGVKRSPTKKGMKSYSRLRVSGRRDLQLFADLIGFEDPRIQSRVLRYLSTIEKENKETDRSIPIESRSLRTLLRQTGIMREGFDRTEVPAIIKETAWYHAYSDAMRKGRLSRTKLVLIVATISDHLREVDRSASAMRLNGKLLRHHAALIGMPTQALAAELGFSRKKLTRILRNGSNVELSRVASHLKGETHGILKYASNRLEGLRKLANSSVEFDKIVSVKKEDYDGLVYDLTVPEYANFVAGKGATICHNTSLVQAITGVWASAHSEELKRGITIKVGYADAAFYECPDTPPPEAYSTSPVCPVCGKPTNFLRAVSFVDSPGHESLMTNMLAGAALMDGVILVITANEPVPMPQTREHMLALQMLGMKKMVVVQNKIDRVDADGARKNYEAIKQFLSNTVGADAPVIPVSAQNRINIDALIQSLEETIPTPKHDLNAAPKMYILRSFDVNRPGADVKSLVGGVLGGSLVSGELSVGDEIEISPGIAEERSGKYSPILTRVSSLGTGAGMTEKVGPGGLIALGTSLDPRLTKGDVLVGNLIGKPGSLPPSRTHITIDLQLFDQAVGSSALIKVDKVRATETLRLNIGTASTLGTVTSARDTVAELDLKKPVVADENGRVAISRRIAERWRLIGSGLVR